MKSIKKYINEAHQFLVKGHVKSQIKMVDLELPSGNLWAACNFGADKPEEIGKFYAWGELEQKDRYDWDTYKFGNPNEEDPKLRGFTKYSYADNKQELDLEDDIINKTLRNNWHIPSKKDIDELTSTKYVDLGFDELYGMKGLLITSKQNNNTLFLPIAGIYRRAEHIHKNHRCLYMTRTLADVNDYEYKREYALEITESGYDEDWDVVRRNGCQIRPVKYIK